MYFLTIALITLAVFLYYRLKKNLKYFEDRQIPHEPGSVLVGSFGKVILRKQHRFQLNEILYQKHSDKRLFGYFKLLRKQFIIRDLELIKELTIKNFDIFREHFSFNASENDELLGKTVLRLAGEEWKQMRAAISPCFTGNRMRQLFPLIDEVARRFATHFHAKEKTEIEAKAVFSRYATDVIASTAFGISIDSLKDPSNEFFTKGMRLIKFDFFVLLRVLALHFFPNVAKYLKIRLFPHNVFRFFERIVAESIKNRKEERVVRPDLIHLLMEAQNGRLEYESNGNDEFASVEESSIGRSSEKMRLTDGHIVAQSLQFFFSTFDTTSTAAAFMAHELAANPAVQQKLYEEVRPVYEQNSGEFSYAALSGLKYLDQVVSETLRLWPPTFETDRLCNQNIKLQSIGNEPQVEIEKGLVVIVPIMAIHRDAKYFPEPNRFEPERFNSENKSKIVSGSYLPFGVGPRSCLGSRFAILVIKLLIVHLIYKFKLSPTEKTQLPMKISARQNSLEPACGGFYLGIKPRNKTDGK